ncbi:hypothetical protein Taro_046331 [Colocasia esculenta]|uniref:Uncharacterized protein n=1 Tax=Colocasia esculenta TaxID=4460 RepID=A0A843WYN8_COLES|nr:hypothetical protein [Colocasia esculenta]
MGYMLRARLSSSFPSIIVTSQLGLYFLHKDYMIAQEAISHQIHVRTRKFKREKLTALVALASAAKLHSHGTHVAPHGLPPQQSGAIDSGGGGGDQR